MVLTFENKKIKLPDFLIVGAAKSGTSSLWKYLNRHPQVFFPVMKEPRFFNFYNNPPRYTNSEPLRHVVSDVDEYSSLFQNAEFHQLLSDCSPTYLYAYKATIRNMKTLYGPDYKQAKIIIILRHPAERAWSQYMHFRKFNHEPLSFQEAIAPDTIRERKQNNWNLFFDYIGFGHYSEQVAAFQTEFPKTIVKLYDDLKDNERELMKALCQFLEIDEHFVPNNLDTYYNISGVPKNRFSEMMSKVFFRQNPLKKAASYMVPERVKVDLYYRLERVFLKRAKMPEESRQALIKYYTPEIKKLEKIIGRNLSAWLK